MARDRDAGRPTRTVRALLALVMAVEVMFVVKLVGEGRPGNVWMIVDSVGLLVGSVLVWRGVGVGRPAFAAFLAWRVVQIVVDMASHFGPGDHRFVGTFILLAFYLCAGAAVISPLGRPRDHRAP